MLSAEEQLERIEAQLLGTGGIPTVEGVILLDPGDLTGSLDIDLRYPSGYQASRPFGKV